VKKLQSVFSFPFYAILLGILPVLFLWQHNLGQVSTGGAFISFLYTLPVIIAIWLLCRLIFRSAQKASVIASIVFLLFFSFGHVYSLFESEKAAAWNIGFFKLAVVYAVLLAAGVFLTIKIRKHSHNLVTWLNLILILLVVINTAAIIRFQSRVTTADRSRAQIEPEPRTGRDHTQPDVYYFIFDSYAREDVFSGMLGYDNSAFIHALEERGFYIADCANSNYDGTLASLGSSLNYEYLDEAVLSDEAGIINRFKNSQIRQYFSSKGYQFVTARGFSSFNDINDSDIYLNYRKDLGEQDNLEQVGFANLYLKTTLVRILYELYDMDPVRYDLLPYWLYSGEKTSTVMGHAAYWYYQTNYMFDAIPLLPEDEGPYFVYAHFNPPHGPYVFAANGNFRYVHEPADPRQYYLDAVIYLNEQILKMIDDILAKSSVPPIIVIQGDHAPQLLTEGYDKHKILNAYYFPEGRKAQLYETITPVNTFRVILNEFFGEELPLLPDTIFVKLLNQREGKPSQCTYP
jgi:hypothetical protein